MPYTSTYKEGSRYEETKGMDIKDIAKLVRKDLKEAYPSVKFGVRIERFSMGQAINITANGTGIGDRHGEQGRDFQNKVKAIVNEYNFDNSDPMTDYFCVRFYCNQVRIES